MGLTFGQVEDVLATAFYVKDEARRKFQARLKQWQKMGFPEGVNVGRGARASYGATQLYQLAFFMRLLWLGITPERAQIIINSTWPKLRQMIGSETTRIAADQPGFSYAVFQIMGLTELTDPDADHLHVHFYPTADSHFAAAMGDDPEDYAPEDRDSFLQFRSAFMNMLAQGAIVVEVSSLLMRLWGSMIYHQQEPALLADDVRDWAVQHELEDAASKVSEGPPMTDNLGEAGVWDHHPPVQLARRSLRLPPELEGITDGSDQKA